MRLLIDENLSPIIAEALEVSGHDVRTVLAALTAAPDDDVMSLAIAEGRVIVTEDKDFGELAFRVGMRPRSI